MARYENAKLQIQLTVTAYAGSASTSTTTNVKRWIRDGTQVGASTQSATKRLKKLIANAAGN